MTNKRALFVFESQYHQVTTISSHRNDLKFCLKSKVNVSKNRENISYQALLSWRQAYFEHDPYHHQFHLTILKYKHHHYCGDDQDELYGLIKACSLENVYEFLENVWEKLQKCYEILCYKVAFLHDENFFQTNVLEFTHSAPPIQLQLHFPSCLIASANQAYLNQSTEFSDVFI